MDIVVSRVGSLTGADVATLHDPAVTSSRRISYTFEHEHLRKVLAELIAGDLGKDLHTRPKAAGSNPSDLLVPYVASTFILVLNWWVESKSRPRPAAANDVFRALVLPTLAGT